MKSIRNNAKLTSIIAILILAIVVFVGCNNKNKDTEQKNPLNNEATDSKPNQDEDSIIDESENDDKENTANENITEDDNTANVDAEKININIAALKGPTGMGMAKLMEDANEGIGANNYSFTIAGEADQISAGLINGDIDIAAVPCNLASVLYNRTEGQIRIAAINTLGVLYIVETGDTITSVEDLKGKTIYSTGYGTTPQYTLNYLLSSYGLDPDKDLTIEYKSEATEVAALLENASDAIAMLPQPYVTTVMMNNDKVRIALDIEKEWVAKNEGSGVVTGVLVVNSQFLDNNPQAVDAFLTDYQKSANFANENIETAADLIEKHGLFKAAVAKKAIPYCNITFIDGPEMKEKVEAYLNVLFEQNPKAVGGAMPAEDFYYIP
ncbi:MAG: ABC transporter substrate-binding protein [Clostridiales bacterium]|nr:ABC transporter substrate-binding protein [Bacillota bacterium]NLK02817.1 ABC transporter substrate-binding protein [Clostridiales bacterium]